MSNKMTDEYILSKGYHEYKPTHFDSPGVEKRFQKRFDDDKGKKYFIDIKKWEPITHPHTGEVFDLGYECETQMYKKDTHDAVNFDFLSSWDLDSVEEFMEKQFATGMFDYYEVWNE